jgi:DnaK suppressor protein
MTPIELNRFRTLLETRRSELESGSANREALAIDTSPEDLDRIQQASERDLAMRMLEGNSSRLREVQAALRRMDANAYGICIECEESISPKRLAAVPWTSYCIVCQEAADREQEEPWSETGAEIETAA